MITHGIPRLFGVSVATNAVLAVVLVVKLQVTPGAVKATIEQLELRRDIQVQELQARQNAMLVELAERGEWITDHSEWRAELDAKTHDRFRSSDFNSWAKKNGLPLFERTNGVERP